MKDEAKAPATEIAAHQFLDSAQTFLAEAMGGKFDLKDLADFSKVVAGGLLGSIFAILRKESGKAQAEAWLNQSLSVAGSWVRLHGADAMVKFSVEVKDAPNTLHAKAPSPLKEAIDVKTEKPACSCIVSPKGRCEQCVSRIQRVLESNLESWRSVYREEKKICPGCMVTQTDEALSRVAPMVRDIIEEAPDGEKEVVSGSLALVLEQIATVHGVTDLPRTREAMAKLMA